jgi:DNA polymerase III subunit delta
MAELKPAYLIHGEDHGAISERRAGLRALGEAGQDGAGSVELLEGEAGTPAGVAHALAAMTLAVGRRVILVEGVERWRQAEVEAHLAPAFSAMPPDTTVALFAREEPRVKAPEAVHAAVKRAGGQIVAQATVKPWELGGWVREQGARLGLSLDAAAAKALVSQVGERQQRLLRELEKLALEGDSPAPGAHATERVIGAEQIDRVAAHSTEWRAFTLADALVGADAREATLSYLRVREQGESLSGLIYLMAKRLREALEVARRLGAGESTADVTRGLRMPARAAKRFVADIERSDPDRLRHALGALADLELDSRGGAPLSSGRSELTPLGDDTLALRAVAEITR